MEVVGKGEAELRTELRVKPVATLGAQYDTASRWTHHLVDWARVGSLLSAGELNTWGHRGRGPVTYIAVCDGNMITNTLW